jgi:hypothetical protein
MKRQNAASERQMYVNIVPTPYALNLAQKNSVRMRTAAISSLHHMSCFLGRRNLPFEAEAFEAAWSFEA